MAQISVSNLTFCYEGSFDNIFEDVSFVIDTDWRLGLIGRNGKGKTTFLNLLMGRQKQRETALKAGGQDHRAQAVQLYEYQGHISAAAVFDYFPYRISEEQTERCFAEFMEELKADCELWRVICELEKLQLEADVLYRPFRTLSHGERTKVMLAILFCGENDFLLIDEPTNHLDQESRDIVKEYLRQKKGFILVSHDRDLLDACIDHVLVLNRSTIEVQTGNFSSWWENKKRADAFHEAENEKHRKEIRRLNKAAEKTREWADKSEQSKIGFDPIKDPGHGGKRAYIGSKTKKMQSRRMQIEKRIAGEVEQKEGLLQDIEHPAELKLMPLQHHKEVLISARDYGISYQTGQREPQKVFSDLRFEVCRGERVFLHGRNGCGKSSLIKAVLARSTQGSGCGVSDKIKSGSNVCSSFGNRDRSWAGADGAGNGTSSDGITGIIHETGTLTLASGLVISYINQDTSYLRGSLKEFCKANGLDESLFLAILRQLDLERVQFAKDMQEYSEGQKKKVLIAASLLRPAHLYVWDEPLNYIDVFSRMQIENLILSCQPTMLIVEHDVRFREKIGTKIVEL